MSERRLDLSGDGLLSMEEMRQYPLCPLRTSEVLYQGAVLWCAENVKPPELSDVVWRLIQDAAETGRAIRRATPRGAGTSWPDIVRTHAELFAAARENVDEAERAAKEGREPVLFYEPDQRRASPSMQALARFDDVMKWLRYVVVKDPNQRRARIAMLLAHAGGMSAETCVRAFPTLQMRSYKNVHGARERAIKNIEDELRRVCPKIRVGVAA